MSMARNSSQRGDLSSIVSSLLRVELEREQTGVSVDYVSELTIVCVCVYV